MIDHTEKTTAILQQIQLLKNKHDELAAVTGEDFNVFSILGIKHRETITHTPILVELLNPHGSHRQGVAFLELFLKRCIGQGGTELLETKGFLNNLELYRVRSEERPDQAQFDILLEKDDACIVIENKIYADDQPSQLNRLYQDAKKNFKDDQIKLVYLTLDGSKPSAKSLQATNGQTTKLSRDKVTCISYDEEVISWLEDCIRAEQVQRISPIREVLFQYRNLLKELTGQPTKTRYFMELSNLLTDDKYCELIPHLETALLEAKKQSQIEFWNELFEKLGVEEQGIIEKGKLRDNVHNYYVDKRVRGFMGKNDRSFSRNYLPDNCKQLEIASELKIAIGVEIQSDGRIFYGFVLLDKDKSDKWILFSDFQNEKYNSLVEKLVEKLPDRFVHGDLWLGWTWPNSGLKFPVEYRGEGAGSKELSLLIDKKYRKEVVDKLAKEIKDEVEKFKQNLSEK